MVILHPTWPHWLLEESEYPQSPNDWYYFWLHHDLLNTTVCRFNLAPARLINYQSVHVGVYFVCCWPSRDSDYFEPWYYDGKMQHIQLFKRQLQVSRHHLLKKVASRGTSFFTGVGTYVGVVFCLTQLLNVWKDIWCCCRTELEAKFKNRLTPSSPSMRLLSLGYDWIIP